MANLFNNILVPAFDLEFSYNNDHPTTQWTHLMKLVLMIKKYPETINIVRNIIINTPEEIHLTNSDGKHALIFACLECNNFSSIECVKLLIDYGANIHKGDLYCVTSLMLASQYSNSTSSIECVKLLIDSGADINGADTYGQCPLMYATLSANSECFKLLVGCGADINDCDNYYQTSLMKLMQIVSSHYRNPSTETIDETYIANVIEFIKVRIDLGTDVNFPDWWDSTVLMYACKNFVPFFSNNCIHLLINSGANVNHKDQNNNTCLMYLFTTSPTTFVESDVDIIMTLIYESKLTICDKNHYNDTAYDIYVKNHHIILSDDQIEYLKGNKVLSVTRSAKNATINEY